jgi:hypothetical protein
MAGYWTFCEGFFEVGTRSFDLGTTCLTCGFSTVRSFGTWFGIAAFDFVASFGIDAPGIAGASAALQWSEEAIVIALRLRASNADMSCAVEFR